MARNEPDPPDPDRPASVNPREKGDVAFGKRVQMACERSTKLPSKNYGLFSEIRKRLESEYSVVVTLETVRKWYNGMVVPRRDKLEPLAAVLGVDPIWLQYGTKGAVQTSERNRFSAIVPGGVNLVVGALQWHGFSVAFLDEEDPNEGLGHFHVIYRGRTRLCFVSAATEGEGGEKLLTVPAQYEKLTCIGVVPTGDMMFDFLALSHDLVRSAGREAAATIELSATPDRGGWRIGSTVLRHAKSPQELLG